MLAKQFQRVSTERLLISPNGRWCLTAYCSHISLFTDLGIEGPWLQPSQHPP